ncbi:MAG: RhuM family protein [bacterium]
MLWWVRRGAGGGGGWWERVEFFRTARQNTSLHIQSVPEDRARPEDPVVKDYLTVQAEGARSVQPSVQRHALDMVIAVGYRVRSRRGVRLCQWAMATLAERATKGFAIAAGRAKEGTDGDRDSFNELPPGQVIKEVRIELVDDGGFFVGDADVEVDHQLSELVTVDQPNSAGRRMVVGARSRETAGGRLVRDLQPSGRWGDPSCTSWRTQTAKGPYLPATGMMTDESDPATSGEPDLSDSSGGRARAEVGAGTAASGAGAGAAERWLSEHGDILWRFALGRTGSREAAEEVVQETLLAAMRSHATYAGASTERTWLLGIAAHKIADHFRGLRRQLGRDGGATTEGPAKDRHSAERMFSSRGMWARKPGDWGRSISAAGERDEALAALRRCLDRLPPSQAEAVWLRDLLCIPGDEVCKLMAISPTNLWSRMHRARAALRACVELSMGERTGETR